MNRFLLQFFLIIAVIPIAFFFGTVFLVFAPLICWGLALNSYRFNNNQEMYFWLILGAIAFSISLYILGVL
jgi:hypothetical protein